MLYHNTVLTGLSILLYNISTAIIPVQFNPSNYSETEGADSNAVITLEVLENHPSFAFTVTVLMENGSAICESCHSWYILFISR